MIGKIAPRRGTCKKATKSGKNKSQQQAMPVIEPAAAVPIQVSNK